MGLALVSGEPHLFRHLAFRFCVRLRICPVLDGVTPADQHTRDVQHLLGGPAAPRNPLARLIGDSLGVLETSRQTTHEAERLKTVQRDKDKATPFLKPKRKRRKALRGPRHKGRPLPRSFT